jgi:hypothetical protein
LDDFAARCVTPRTGFDLVTGRPFPDKKGTVSDEKAWLRAWTDAYYLWYREVPPSDPNKFAGPLEYFEVLKTPALTPSLAPKDKFHFTAVTSEWEALSQSGVEAGYGAQWVLVSRAPPREARVAYTEPNSPATDNGLARGAKVIAVDGAAVLDGNKDILNAGLFPGPGETHTFSILDLGQTQPRPVTMTSKSIVSVPVKNTGIVPGTTTVGYMLFNDHLALAEKALVDAVNQLKGAGATELVLDIRYNGGGYLYIASELAYMIAGPTRTFGKTFEKTIFNDKYTTKNPITGEDLQPTPFVDKTVGFSVAAGAQLPTLNLGRVYVLSGSGTCSASEAIINGLLGVDVEVVLIGKSTCGKPYGFYPEDNCGTTYFSIQFEGVNAKGFGDYSDGFIPGGSGPAHVTGCDVEDDFTHPLGDPAEARLAAALRYRATASCAGAFSGARAVASGPDGWMYKSPWRMNRILRR